MSTVEDAVDVNDVEPIEIPITSRNGEDDDGERTQSNRSIMKSLSNIFGGGETSNNNASSPALSEVLARTPTLLTGGQVADTFLCQICYENHAFSKMAHYRLKSCGHQFCKECLDGYWTVRVMEAEMDLNCTWLDDSGDACGFPVGYDEVKQIVAPQVYDKWEWFKRQNANAALRKCPYPGCGHEQTGDPSNPKMFCGKCTREFCFLHSNAHIGGNCADYEKQMVREYRKVKQAAGKCVECVNPQCGYLITKNGGCNHMTCSRCNAEFCWICHEDIKGRVGAHYSSGGICSCVQFPYHRFPYVEDEVPCWYRILKSIFLIIMGTVYLPPLMIFGLFVFILASPAFVYVYCEATGRYFQIWVDNYVTVVGGCLCALIFGPPFLALSLAMCVPCFPCFICGCIEDPDDYIQAVLAFAMFIVMGPVALPILIPFGIIACIICGLTCTNLCDIIEKDHGLPF